MKFDNPKSLSESVIARGLDLSESARWRDYTVAIREGYKEKRGHSIPETVVATTATLLQNTYDTISQMNETTRVVNMGSFIDYGFDVITAFVPNLIAHDILSVQPMNARHSTIFYLQYLYGNDKGTIGKGDIMNSPFTGSTGNTHFSDEVVEGEVIGVGTGIETAFTASLGYVPVKPKTATILVEGTPVAEFASASGSVETLSGTGVTACTVNIATGAVSITFSAGVTLNDVITINYRYDMDLTTVGFSQVDLDLRSLSIEAHPRKLRARWLLDAAFELQKMKGELLAA